MLFCFVSSVYLSLRASVLKIRILSMRNNLVDLTLLSWKIKNRRRKNSFSFLATSLFISTLHYLFFENIIIFSHLECLVQTRKSALVHRKVQLSKGVKSWWRELPSLLKMICSRVLPSPRARGQPSSLLRVEMEVGSNPGVRQDNKWFIWPGKLHKSAR